MPSRKAMMGSRREFLSNILGMALVSVTAWPIRAGEARSTRGQSNTTTSKAGRATRKTSLHWDVFLASSIPAITSDLPPGEKQRPWPPIPSTLISGERDAVLVGTPTTVDAMLGDATLFSHRDGVEATWVLFTPILDAWAKNPDTSFPNYSAGSWGPGNVATPSTAEAPGPDV
jgi:hypothetical protein